MINVLVMSSSSSLPNSSSPLVARTARTARRQRQPVAGGKSGDSCGMQTIVGARKPITSCSSAARMSSRGEKTRTQSKTMATSKKNTERSFSSTDGAGNTSGPLAPVQDGLCVIFYTYFIIASITIICLASGSKSTVAALSWEHSRVGKYSCVLWRCARSAGCTVVGGWARSFGRPAKMIPSQELRANEPIKSRPQRARYE